MTDDRDVTRDASIVERFLAAMPHHAAAYPDARAPAAERWRRAAATLGVPCPPALVLLAAAQDHRRIFASPWELLEPEGALAAHGEIEVLARTMPCLAPHAQMLPLFTADGDLLLLGQDGAIRRCSLASGALAYDHGVVTPSLAALLDAMLEARSSDDEEEEERSVPGLTEWYAPHGGGWIWVDEIEYQLFVHHHHEARDGVWTCITSLTGDLAPHYFRWPDGPDRPPLDGHRERARAPFTVTFVGDPQVLPRALPVGLLAHGERRIDLAVEGERLVRAALAHGWTGRDGRKFAFDGWALFGLSAPARG